MATKSKKNVIKDQAGKVSDSPDACEVKADSRAAGPDTIDESVEERYNAAVERCGLNMPLLLQEILREVMYLRAGK
jgi:hypothetical protein